MVLSFTHCPLTLPATSLSPSTSLHLFIYSATTLISPPPPLTLMNVFNWSFPSPFRALWPAFYWAARSTFLKSKSDFSNLWLQGHSTPLLSGERTKYLTQSCTICLNLFLSPSCVQCFSHFPRFTFSPSTAPTSLVHRWLHTPFLPLLYNSFLCSALTN